MTVILTGKVVGYLKVLRRSKGVSVRFSSSAMFISGVKLNFCSGQESLLIFGI